MAVYQYTKTVRPQALLNDIFDAGLSAPVRVDTVDADIFIHYASDLSAQDQATLTQVVNDFDLAAAIQDETIFYSIADRRLWAEDMMQRLKKRNYDANVSLAQSLWVHKRLRQLEFTVLQAHADALPYLSPVVGITFQIDLMNLVVSGDIETAYAALLCTTPDDMSQPYHALSQDMINWIMGEIASYLGWT